MAGGPRRSCRRASPCSLRVRRKSAARASRRFLKATSQELRADVALSATPACGTSRRAAISTIAARPVEVEVTLTAAGARSALGHVRQRRAEPARRAGIGAGPALHDSAGRVQLPGFYDSVPRSRRRSTAVGNARLRPGGVSGDVGIVDPRRRARPHDAGADLGAADGDVNGIWGGYTQPGVKTVIPSKASAKVSASGWCRTRTRGGCWRARGSSWTRRFRWLLLRDQGARAPRRDPPAGGLAYVRAGARALAAAFAASRS